MTRQTEFGFDTPRKGWWFTYAAIDADVALQTAADMGLRAFSPRAATVRVLVKDAADLNNFVREYRATLTFAEKLKQQQYG